MRVLQRDGALHVHRRRRAGGAQQHLLLQADVTANDEDDQALLKHFGIFGPPTIAFYGADGEERRNFRVVGFMEAAEFAAVVRQAVAGDPTDT